MAVITQSASIPPFYVALYGGFLCVETYTPLPNTARRTDADGNISKYYTVADVRMATPWPSFEDADAAAKWATGLLYPPDLRYSAVLAPSFGTRE